MHHPNHLPPPFMPSGYSYNELRAMEREHEAAVEAYEAALAELPVASASPERAVRPLSGTESENKLRPRRLDEIVGQERLKPLLRRLIDNAKRMDRPLSHMLFVGAAGTGKTTFASVIANEVGTRVFALKAPLDMEILMSLREAAQDRDVVFVDEVHMQVSGDRRGITQACDPESFYMLLEDGVLSTATGPMKFPAVTWIGATTDVGLLPQPLSDRFTIQPRLAPYTTEDMVTIADANARALHLRCQSAAIALFAGASRGIPRQVNNYVRSAGDLTITGDVSVELAREVVEDLASTTLDGLTDSMQAVLRFLYLHGRRETKDGVVYSASVNSLATACGHGRDTKAIALLVEPYLIQRGLLAVRPSGRVLTPAGVERARQLIGGTVWSSPV